MNEIINKVFEKIDFTSPKVCKRMTFNSSDCLSCFQNQFFNNNVVSYNCRQKRYIYVARYFPVHVAEISAGLDLIPDETIKNIINHDQINILNIGGGPASDCYAIKKLFQRYENAGKLNKHIDMYVLRLDIEKKWNGIAAFINGKLNNSDCLTIDHRRNHSDITDKTLLNIGNKKKFNIITLSYVISELSHDDISHLANIINCNSANNVSVVLVNDRETFTVTSNVDSLFQQLTSNVNFEDSDNTSFHCGISYPDEICQAVNPKLKTSSKRFLKILYS